MPILDHGAYVMLGNDELFLKMLAEGAPFERIRDYAGWTINAAKRSEEHTSELQSL